MKDLFENFTNDDALITGQKIRTERLRRGLTQSDMGEMMGLSTSYISSLERGQRRVSWNVGRKHHQCFGISYDYMMENSGHISPYGDLLREPDGNELHHRFLVLLGTCTDQELLACYQMCRSFIASARKSAMGNGFGRRGTEGNSTVQAESVLHEKTDRSSSAPAQSDSISSSDTQKPTDETP